MRYVSVNKDGSIATWATVPLKIINNSSNEEFIVIGVRKRNSQTWIYGYWTRKNKKVTVQVPEEVNVGEETFDISDMPADHLPGLTIIFPDFEKDILPKLPSILKDQYSHYRVIKREDLIKDEHRIFRTAFIDDGNNISVHMGNAKEIHKNILRAKRAPMLSDLDVQIAIAVEKSDKKTKEDVIEKKKKLRDITEHPKISAAKTPDELLSLTIEHLLNG